MSSKTDKLTSAFGFFIAVAANPFGMMLYLALAYVSLKGLATLFS